MAKKSASKGLTPMKQKTRPGVKPSPVKPFAIKKKGK